MVRFSYDISLRSVSYQVCYRVRALYVSPEQLRSWTLWKFEFHCFQYSLEWIGIGR